MLYELRDGSNTNYVEFKDVWRLWVMSMLIIEWVESWKLKSRLAYFIVVI